MSLNNNNLKKINLFDIIISIINCGYNFISFIIGWGLIYAFFKTWGDAAFQVSPEIYEQAMKSKEETPLYVMFSKSSILSYTFIQGNYEINNNLGFIEGFQNFYLSIALYLKTVLVKSFFSGITSKNIIFGIIVFFVMLVVNFNLCIFSTISLWFKLLNINALPEYYIGFLATPIIMLVLHMSIVILTPFSCSAKKNS